MTADFGNANSVEHLYGENAAELVANARSEVARLVGGEPEGVRFTSGSSEAIWLAFSHAVLTCRHRPVRVAVSVVEHRAVLETVAAHEVAGNVAVSWIPVDMQARLDITALEAACKNGIDLVCVMAANNEVGTIYPIREVARIASRVGARTFVDATQAAGRIPIESGTWGVTYLALSAHKIYGPKGVGALVVPSWVDFDLDQGPDYRGSRGTPNVPGIAGFGEACRLRRIEMHTDEPRMAAQRDRLESLLLENISDATVNGDRSSRLSNNLHLSVTGTPNDAVVMRLRHQVAVSTGAACSSGAMEPSHVLRAMGLPSEQVQGALRISGGKFTTNQEIQMAAEYISMAVTSTRSAIRGTLY